MCRGHVQYSAFALNSQFLLQALKLGDFFFFFGLFVSFVQNKYMASQVALVVKNLSANAGDLRDANWIPGLGRSPGVENGNPLQYSCLEIPWTEEPGGLQSMGL